MAATHHEHRDSSSSSLEHNDKASDTIAYAEKIVDPKLKAASGPLSDDDRDWLASVDDKTQRKMYHKVDVRLVPMLAILYLIAHLDRASK